jgi:opacity protein-like surface antigen
MKKPFTRLVLLALLAAAAPALAVEPDAPPPWSAAVRAGAVVLRLVGVSDHPIGPDVELSLGRTIYEYVSVEVNAGAYTATLARTGTRLTVFPLTVSLKLTAAPDFGFEGYAVVGLGANLTRLRGGSLAAASESDVAYHAGLGVRRRFGENLFVGLEGRLFTQGAAGPLGGIDGLRLSALAGALF